ncbi:MAG: Spy/CpxP family protein refolding chaperone [Burkholderiales bacterium]
MKPIMIVCLVWLCLACLPLSAQEAGVTPRQDPIGEHVLPPELIMQHQKAIGLSESQRNAVIGEIKRTQGRLVDVQWGLQQAVERMAELLKQEKVDEQLVLAQLDNVLAVEREVKRAHIALAVHLKNILTPEQQRMLRELRAGQSRPSEPSPRR